MLGNKTFNFLTACCLEKSYKYINFMHYSYRPIKLSINTVLTFLSRLGNCGLTSRSIQFLTASLKSNPKHLTELHLMGNNLDDSGIGMLEELTSNHKYAIRVSTDENVSE